MKEESMGVFIFLNICCSITFGLWMSSIYAGLFVFFAIILIYGFAEEFK